MSYRFVVLLGSWLVDKLGFLEFALAGGACGRIFDGKVSWSGRSERGSFLMRISPTLRGDLAGGVTASFLSLPQSMAYGLLVFAPLGPDYLPLGLVAGLIALCFSNFGSAWFGRIPIMSNSPFSMTSVMLASALTILLHQSGQNRPFSLVMLMFVCFLVGLLQLLMGFLKLGNLAKYIPYPVIAGLINGTAIA
ncbi:MAG: SulP family inorganic anion transporter, partial [Bacteroidota bacterium]